LDKTYDEEKIVAPKKKKELTAKQIEARELPYFYYCHKFLCDT
jgi:hypothetical protein